MILFLCDNERVYHTIKAAADALGLEYEFRCMLGSRISHLIPCLNTKTSPEEALSYDLLFSAHASQIVPKNITDNMLCVNLHPGLSPDNRGMFPHIFSMMNGLPAGVTLHVMDEQIDHGPIIAQKEVKINSWDTSWDVLEKLYQAEVEVFNENIKSIIDRTFKATPMPHEGNINRKKDFKRICELDLNDCDTLQNHLNKLRALTHAGYDNAYFVDDHGNKVFVSVNLCRKL